MSVKLIAECTSPDCIDSINGIIHDCTFRVSDVSFDTEYETVRVPFRPVEGVVASWFSFRKRKRHPDFALEICNAKLVECEDTQRIEAYDFNQLEYDSESGLLTIRTGIPMKFSVKVEGLRVKITTSNNRGRNALQGVSMR